MASTRVDYNEMDWASAVPFYGPAAVYQGKDIVQLKVLSDRRGEGGGIAWLVKFTPPPGKLIKIVATALSDEHIFGLQGGRSTKSGQPAQGSRRLRPQPQGPAAQRHDRAGDHGARHLCRRARSHRLDGSGRRQPGWVSTAGRAAGDVGQHRHHHDRAAEEATRSLGSSPKASHTQSGPSGVCRMPNSAPRVAETSGVPCARRAGQAELARRTARAGEAVPGADRRRLREGQHDRGTGKGREADRRHHVDAGACAGTAVTVAIRAAMAKASRSPSRRLSPRPAPP